MLNLIGRLRQSLKATRNRRIADFAGTGAELWGSLEKRHPKSSIRIGERSRILGHLVTEQAHSRLEIGEQSLVGSGTIIDCAHSITVSDHVLISYGCIIADSDNHSLSYSKRKDDLERWRTGTHDWSTVACKPVHIEKGAWIGARSIILKGVTVGEGAVVGMGSVVTKDVSPYTVVAGNPARLIRQIEER